MYLYYQLYNNKLCGSRPYRAHLIPKLPSVGTFFSYRCLVPPTKCPKKMLVLFGVIQVERPKNVVFEHTHSNQIFEKINIV